LLKPTSALEPMARAIRDPIKNTSKAKTTGKAYVVTKDIMRSAVKPVPPKLRLRYSVILGFIAIGKSLFVQLANSGGGGSRHEE
jgi:hypothetical protein